MSMDVARTTEAVAKWGPWQIGGAIVVLCLLIVAGGGWILHEDLQAVHEDLVELRSAVEQQGREAAAAREEFRALQARMTNLLQAMCFNASNGSTESWQRCENALLQIE